VKSVGVSFMILWCPVPDVDWHHPIRPLVV
jgi:hypothetical protein